MCIRDRLNIGRIFGVEAYTQVKVEHYRAELAKIERVVGVIEDSLRVFVYDSGADTPMTAAKFAMPNAMIEAAGGTNIFNDVASSWVHVNLEDVVDRNPEHIVIIDYDAPKALVKIVILKSQVGLADIDAFRIVKFVVLDYAEATPVPRNVASTYTLAKAFYPDRFSNWEMLQILLDQNNFHFLNLLHFYMTRHLELHKIYGKSPAANKTAKEYFTRMITSAVSYFPTEGDYLLGEEFSGADIMMVSCLNLADRFNIKLPSAIMDYRARVASRPTYAEAIKANTP